MIPIGPASLPASQSLIPVGPARIPVILNLIQDRNLLRERYLNGWTKPERQREAEITPVIDMSGS